MKIIERVAAAMIVLEAMKAGNHTSIYATECNKYEEEDFMELLEKYGLKEVEVSP